ncbi:MAG: Gfo/Idh/MocA family oxidoreductase [Verrucomicrobiota bacterium]|nr:Gfo/Idh/MocA family oxidoreductase [Verrucomicrobiota bacterium]
MKPSSAKRFQYSRRSFLSTAASSAFAFQFLPSRVFGANNRLQVAGIGVGGKGKGDFDGLAMHGDVVAACDIDARRLDVAVRKHENAAKFSDYREMLSQLGDKIDAITVSTADHTHAPAAMMAMKQGIHVYVQKPLTHTVWEARQLALVARQKNVCTQMGNQGTASDGIREGAEFVQSGGIGVVKEIHAWTNRPVWPQAPMITARPTEKMDVPSHLDWNSFIGPAPMRPYHSCYTPFKWRGWLDYGTGALGDMACHTTNLAFMACGLTQPTRVESVNTGPINGETFPSWATVHMDFPKSEKSGAIKFHWYEGKVGNDGKENKGIKNLPPMDYFHGETPKNSGLLLIGSDGILYSPNDYGADWKVFKDGKWHGKDQVEKPTPFLPRNGRGDNGMKEELVKAIRENDPKIAMSNFDYAGNMTEAILLGNVAMLAGGKFKWDAKKLKTSRKDANKLISKVYRTGWEVDPA